MFLRYFCRARAARIYCNAARLFICADYIRQYGIYADARLTSEKSHELAAYIHKLFL